MSSYTSLMVSVDLSPAATGRIGLACGLADRFGARVIGAAAAPAFVPVYGKMSPTEFARLAEEERERALEALEQARRTFAKVAGPRGAEWRPATGAPVNHLATQARAADVVIVGRHGPDDAFDHRLGAEAGDLLMKAGRPVLLVPPGVGHLAASRVVVAWKDTREARRAVLASLPLLCAAEAVFLAAVQEDGSPDPEADEGAADVAAFLGRHGVAGVAVCRPELKVSVAYTLLTTAEREGADLIAMGAYGHSRLREWVFGGVTGDLLNASTMCCLMSR